MKTERTSFPELGSQRQNLCILEFICTCVVTNNMATSGGSPCLGQKVKPNLQIGKNILEKHLLLEKPFTQILII